MMSPLKAPDWIETRLLVSKSQKKMEGVNEKKIWGEGGRDKRELRFVRLEKAPIPRFVSPFEAKSLFHKKLKKVNFR